MYFEVFSQSARLAFHDELLPLIRLIDLLEPLTQPKKNIDGSKKSKLLFFLHELTKWSQVFQTLQTKKIAVSR